MEAAWNSGVVLVAAAGNEATMNPSYPSAYPFVLGISATDRNDQLASYSNYGSHIDLAAPGGAGAAACDTGGEILGLALNGNTPCPPPLSTGYTVMAGTSMAAPFVSGVAAVLIAATGYPNSFIVSLMENTADRIGGNMWDEKYGFGRVNMYRALAGDQNANPGVNIRGYAFPNPYSPERSPGGVATFVVTGANGAALKAKLYDVAGNLLWSKSLTAAETASTDLHNNSPLRWDGRDTHGRMAPNGIYFLTLEAGDSRKVVKLAVLH
jgi:subtilisin family serine protease